MTDAADLRPKTLGPVARADGRSEEGAVQPAVPGCPGRAREHGSRVREVRREIAQIKTILREKQLAGEEKLKECPNASCRVW